MAPGVSVDGLRGSAEIDRRDFGVNFEGTLENGSLVVGNKIVLELASRGASEGPREQLERPTNDRNAGAWAPAFCSLRWSHDRGLEGQGRQVDDRRGRRPRHDHLGVVVRAAPVERGSRKSSAGTSPSERLALTLFNGFRFVCSTAPSKFRPRAESRRSSRPPARGCNRWRSGCTSPKRPTTTSGSGSSPRAAWMPAIIGSPVGGVVAERRNRQHWIQSCNFVMAVTASLSPRRN